MDSKKSPKWSLDITTIDAGEMCLQLSGTWKMRANLPDIDIIKKSLGKHTNISKLRIDTSALKTWDTGLLTFLRDLHRLCEAQHIDYNPEELPKGVQSLLLLAEEAPEKYRHLFSSHRISLFEKVGTETLKITAIIMGIIIFVGDISLSLYRLFLGKARFLISDLILFFQEAGVYALGIVTLINFLVGLILAYIGAVQLSQFGAQIYIANLVSIGVIREMAPIMTAIIMAGRTGAAYAAQLGTMQVNEEIDALRTLAIRPMDFLVLPRTLALVLMLPLLCLYGDLVGIMGGGIIGVFVLKLSILRYSVQTLSSISIADVFLGITKSAVFGILIAVASCHRGMKCGRSAEAVGKATTSAVVTSLVLIISADALFAVFTNALGI